ncbi:MAG: hypothetical protein PHW00_02725 [Clostridia bacterium]|nr:hypothetical protein [Clostridia bacterium]
MTKIKDKLYKRALGYTVKEKAEDYSVVDGEMQLVKKRIITKHIPPDITAYKMIVDQQIDLSDYTDEHLEREKQRLLEQLSTKGDKND